MSELNYFFANFIFICPEVKEKMDVYAYPRNFHIYVCFLEQLESTGENVKPHHQLKNTVTMDDSVGNDTTFLVTWQISGPPEILLFDPNGRKYYTNNFITNPALQTARLYIPGTAEVGVVSLFIMTTFS